MWYHESAVAVLCLIWITHLSLIMGNMGNEDRLKRFYQRIEKSDVKFCQDRTKMLPACQECIPGLQKGPHSKTCNEYLPASKAIRDEIRQITLTRFEHQVADRPFGLYPCEFTVKLYISHLLTCFVVYHLPVFSSFYPFTCFVADLEKGEFVSRQIIYGKILSDPHSKVKTVVDIGAYYNPIHLFLSRDVCVENVIIVEPILDALSAYVPCASDHSRKTHVLFLPVTFAHYMKIAASLPRPDSVVCVGCDAHYGPSRSMLETAFQRPYTLYLEFPPAYGTDAAFLSMNGTGPGEELTYLHTIHVATNETKFTTRLMKAIRYTKV